ncbi:MAG: hypothetical protein LBS43_02335 [Prevotellaceae bacterium]|jgi:hypothetical protein|nr:hypothetical protein [Prevotellaceae bacterium]
MNEGILNTVIVNLFSNEFERRCISLLSDAYDAVQANCKLDINSKEEYISAVMFDYIDKSPHAAKWHIDIVPEYRKYKNDMLKGKKMKQTAPQICMTFDGWTSTNLQYFVEAQNIIEFIPPDKKRARQRNPIVISDYHKHYAVKISACLSDKYPAKGCMVAYIFEGETKYTVNCLNHCLCDCNRVPEILKKRHAKLKDIEACYVSVHNNRLMKHLMFNFSSQQNKTDFNQKDE